MEKNVVQLGDFIVVQRQNYTKLHRVSSRESVMLGKDQIDLGVIIGKPTWTTYKMVPKKNAKRAFILETCKSSESLAEQLIKDVSSGLDNRNIFDDGRSQMLSTEEIVSLRTSGLSGQAIVEQLIENSKTFRDKTEYSQEKYLKKKERKYFEYVTIRWPTIRLISEIMFRQDPNKILGLRMDSLSQILMGVGMHSHGKYIVYESGCQALVVAAMLNNLTEPGKLIHIHPGNIAQRNAIRAMNFSEEQLLCLNQVNVYSLLRKLLQNADSLCNENGEVYTTANNKQQAEEEKMPEAYSVIEGEQLIGHKRKHSDNDETENKKPRWEIETEKASELLKLQKADGLVVVGREHPANILFALLPYVAPSRPFVIYSVCREPLLELYLQLKSKSNTAALRVTESWIRKHQILPSRTHPDILMSGGGGYLLTGIVVQNDTI